MMKKAKKTEYFTCIFVFLLMVILSTIGTLAIANQTTVGYYNDFESSISLSSEGFYLFSNQGNFFILLSHPKRSFSQRKNLK